MSLSEGKLGRALQVLLGDQGWDLGDISRDWCLHCSREAPLGEPVPARVWCARERMVLTTSHAIHSPRLWEAMEERCCDSPGCLRSTGNHGERGYRETQVSLEVERLLL